MTSEVISILLIIRLWFRKEHVALKILISLVALIPFAGPALYFFGTDNTPPQPKWLQNRGARGTYTHNWITYRKYMQEIVANHKKRKKNQKTI